MLLMMWLNDWLPSMINQARHPDHRKVFEIMCEMASSAVAFTNGLYAHGLFMDRACTMAMYESGNKFLCGYAVLAKEFMSQKFCAFSMVPKCHMMKHIMVDALSALERGQQTLSEPVDDRVRGQRGYDREAMQDEQEIRF